jgi:GNAT superfamily N-acetyltransferase
MDDEPPHTHPTDPGTVAVRDADRYDAEAIAAILEEIGVTKLLAEPDPLTRQRLRDAITTADAVRHTVLVAVLHGRVIGFIAVHWTHNFRQGVDGFVSDLFVRSDHRGGGGGTALIAEAKRRAASRGSQRLVLFNGKASEAYARGFYPKLGFTEHEELACFILELPPEG